MIAKNKQIHFEKINESNLADAINIQREIFPLESGEEDLRETSKNIVPNHQFLQKYWLSKVDDKYIGICGLYAYKAYPKDAWLGWFGVIEEERRKGYGAQIFKHIIKLAKDFGFENLRLYTDEEDNVAAIKLYKKFGMVSEVYDNPEDVHFEISKTLIFSINLTGEKTILWDNKNLYINSHDEKNK